MKLCVLRVGRGGCDWADQAAEDYARRVRRWSATEEDSVRPERFAGDEARVRREEGRRLLARLGPRDRPVALDERGAVLDSLAFADLLAKARSEGPARLVFVIGGPYGLDEAVRVKADRIVRLSSLVLNHEVARVVLWEQIYRAMTLLERIPYHH